MSKIKKEKLPRPYKNAIIYEDKKLYACLANNPIARGHVVVVWKKEVEDLHLLTRKDYEYLMDRVNEIRDAMLKTLKTEKIYLMYLDEICQVHWHLVPRYNKKGIGHLIGKIGKIKDFSLDDKIRKNLIVNK